MRSIGRNSQPFANPASIYQFTNSPIHQLSNSPTLQFTNSPIHQLSNSPTLQLTNSPAYQLSNLPIPQLSNSLPGARRAGRSGRRAERYGEAWPGGAGRTRRTRRGRTRRLERQRQLADRRQRVAADAERPHVAFVQVEHADDVRRQREDDVGLIGAPGVVREQTADQRHVAQPRNAVGRVPLV